MLEFLKQITGTQPIIPVTVDEVFSETLSEVEKKLKSERITGFSLYLQAKFPQFNTISSMFSKRISSQDIWYNLCQNRTAAEQILRDFLESKHALADLPPVPPIPTTALAPAPAQSDVNLSLTDPSRKVLLRFRLPEGAGEIAVNLSFHDLTSLKNELKKQISTLCSQGGIDEKINHKLLLRLEELGIWFNGKLLSERKAKNLKDGDVLKLEWIISIQQQFFVKTLTGRTLTINIASGENGFTKIMSEIEKQLGTPLFNLIFAGQVLTKDIFYNLACGSTMHAVLPREDFNTKYTVIHSALGEVVVTLDKNKTWKENEIVIAQAFLDLYPNHLSLDDLPQLQQLTLICETQSGKKINNKQSLISALQASDGIVSFSAIIPSEIINKVNKQIKITFNLPNSTESFTNTFRCRNLIDLREQLIQSIRENSNSELSKDTQAQLLDAFDKDNVDLCLHGKVLLNLFEVNAANFDKPKVVLEIRFKNLAYATQPADSTDDTTAPPAP